MIKTLSKLREFFPLTFQSNGFMEWHLWKGNTSAQNLTELNCRGIYVPVVYPASRHIFAVWAGVRKILLRTSLTLRKSSAVSRPWDGGGGGGGGVIQTLRQGEGVSKKFFSALRASVWSKNKRGPGPPVPLPWIRYWNVDSARRV